MTHVLLDLFLPEQVFLVDFLHEFHVVVDAVYLGPQRLIRVITLNFILQLNYQLSNCLYLSIHNLVQVFPPPLILINLLLPLLHASNLLLDESCIRSKFLCILFVFI